MKNLKQYISHVLEEDGKMLSFQQISKELFGIGAKHIYVTPDSVTFVLNDKRFSFPIDDSREMRSEVFFTLINQLLKD